jgi:exodeoxyribonuclease VII small subunit
MPLSMKKSKENITYNEAYLQLQQVVEQIEDDNLQLDALAEKIKLAKELIQYCEKKLRSIEKDIEKLEG